MKRNVWLILGVLVVVFFLVKPKSLPPGGVGNDPVGPLPTK